MIADYWCVNGTDIAFFTRFSQKKSIKGDKRQTGVLAHKLLNCQGMRLAARNTFITRDPHDKVLQYYSEQFGEPREQAGAAVCWQQETQNGNQHILVELTVEVPAQSVLVTYWYRFVGDGICMWREEM